MVSDLGDNGEDDEVDDENYYDDDKSSDSNTRFENQHPGAPNSRKLFIECPS